MKPLHISLNTANSGCKLRIVSCHHSHIFSKSSCLCPHISLPPPHFYRPTIIPTPNAQNISICHASLPQLHSEYPRDCTKPYYRSCLLMTLHTSYNLSTILFTCQKVIEFEVTEVTEHGEKVENEHPEHPEPGFEMIHVIGHDSNTRAVPFETGESTPRTQIDKNGSYEAISSIQFLQQQLV